MALYLSTMALHLAQAGGIFSCIDKLFEWFPHAVRTYPGAILTMAILTMAVVVLTMSVLTRCAPTRAPPLYTMHAPCIQP